MSFAHLTATLGRDAVRLYFQPLLWLLARMHARAGRQSAGEEVETRYGSRRIIEIEALSVRFREGEHDFTALSNITLTVSRGELITLLGPAGAGKTTLLLTLAGFIRPSQGRLWVAGIDLTKCNHRQITQWRQHNVGLVRETGNLNRSWTVAQNVEKALAKPLSRRQRQGYVAAALSFVGLEYRANHFPLQLSRMQRQRAALAQVLVNDPVLVLADNPFAQLDERSEHELLDLLGTINEQFATTIVLATDNATAVLRNSRVLIIDKGHLSTGSRVNANLTFEAG